METVLDTFLDEDTQEEYAERCGGSIRELLRMLHTDYRSISAADTTNIETRQDELYKRGIDEPTLAAFNSFKTRYRAFNLARKVPKTDGQMAIDYSHLRLSKFVIIVLMVSHWFVTPTPTRSPVPCRAADVCFGEQ